MHYSHTGPPFLRIPAPTALVNPFTSAPLFMCGV